MFCLIHLLCKYIYIYIYYIYIYIIYIYVCVCVCVCVCVVWVLWHIKKVVKLGTLVEGDPKAPFSIATTPRCGGGH